MCGFEHKFFGVDFIVSVPPSSSDPFNPQVHLLEFNASPDFHQSGTRLQAEIRKMFDGVVKGVVAPFFDVPTTADVEDDERQNGEEREREKETDWEEGVEKWGWRCALKGEVRRGWA